MTNMNFPPQAYTRETLASAFEWLKSQPVSIKELARSSDDLVALYLQSKRRQNNAGKRYQDPAKELESSQAFREDLKNLAQGLKEFETNSQIVPKRPQIIENHETKSLTKEEPVISTPSVERMESPSSENSAPQQQDNKVQVNIINSMQQNSETRQHQYSPPLNSNNNKEIQILTLDAKSLSMAQQVKDHLNLSSEMEAVRMLIQLGYGKAQKLFDQD